jgi:hypothetical protein
MWAETPSIPFILHVKNLLKKLISGLDIAPGKEQNFRPSFIKPFQQTTMNRFNSEF